MSLHLAEADEASGDPRLADGIIETNKLCSKIKGTPRGLKETAGVTGYHQGRHVAAAN
jgi:hypothetical protein